MKGRRWARWLLLLPVALLVGVVLTPPPDDYAFLGEGATPASLRDVANIVAEGWETHRINDERDRAWRVQPTAVEMKRRIHAGLPACDDTGTAMFYESSLWKRPWLRARTTVYENRDTGAVVILIEDLKEARRTVVVREPHGKSALPGQFRSLVRRAFGR